MFRYSHLHNLVLDPKIDATQLNIITGYVGPSLVDKLQNLPYESNLYIGMYGTHIDPILHKQLQKFNINDRVNIFYTNEPIHSKCYIWSLDDEIVKGLVGSANFSTNGLYTDNKEVLNDIASCDFSDAKKYLEMVAINSRNISTIGIEDLDTNDFTVSEDTIVYNSGKTAQLSFLSTKNGSKPNIIGIVASVGEVHPSAGLNWGFSNALPKPNDAYIPILKGVIESFPDLFPPKGTHNMPIDVIWDDGFHMQMLLEGSQQIGKLVYPKQISSFDDNSILGIYLRKRISQKTGDELVLPIISKREFVNDALEYADKFINTKVLTSYGRSFITAKKIQEATYFLDFSSK